MNHSCAACAKREAYFLCSRCELVRYCGKACQVGHWRWHRRDCAPRRRSASSSSPPSPTHIRASSSLSVNAGELYEDEIHRLLIAESESSPAHSEAFGMHRALQKDSGATSPLLLEPFLKSYAIEKLLGAGIYGIVLSGVMRATGDAVALKFQPITLPSGVDASMGVDADDGGAFAPGKKAPRKVVVTNRRARAAASAQHNLSALFRGTDELQEMRMHHFLTRLYVDNGLDVATHAPVVKEYDYGVVYTHLNEVLARIPSPADRAAAIVRVYTARERDTTRQGQFNALSSDAERAAVATLALRAAYPESAVPHAVAVMERAHMTLEDAIRTYTDQQLIVLLAQVLCTLHSMHSVLAFTHWDLHVRNVLLFVEGAAVSRPVLRYTLSSDVTMHVDTALCNAAVTKLTDFGMSYVRFDAGNAGVHMSRAPELGYKSDNTPTIEGAMDADNASFDLQRLACNIVLMLCNADATGARLRATDPALLRILASMVFNDMQSQTVVNTRSLVARNALAKAVDDHTRLCGALEAVIAARTRGSSLDYESARTVLRDTAWHLMDVPFRHVQGVSATPQSVLLKSPVLRKMLRTDSAALVGRRIIDLSLHVGDSGTGVLPPWGAAIEAASKEDVVSRAKRTRAY